MTTPKTRWKCLGLIALLAALLGAVRPGVAAAQPPGDDSPVTARAVAQHDAIAPGDQLAIAIIIDHGNEFHTWPEKSVKLPPDIDEFAIRTTIALGPDAPAFVRWIGVQWPEAKPGEVPSVSGPGTVSVPLYSGRAVAFAAVQIASGAAEGDVTIPVAVRFQACNDMTCLPDQDLVLPVAVRIAAATPQAVNEPDLFAGLKPIAADAPPTTPPTSAAPAPAAPAPTGRKLFGFEFSNSVLMVFLISALGGAILNLTPCVLPVIPLKIMALTQHGGTPRRRMMLGLWMALGVVAFWFVIGLPMAIFSAQLDPSRLIFGTWWVTMTLGLIIAAMGLGIMGLFMINLPQSVYMVNPKADTPWGSFAFGIMTAVLGLPCFGFVAGGLLAGAATLPPYLIMIVFTGLGVGMAAPYLILSAKPGLVEKIPRTGPASELVKQVMGLLLLAAAAFFLAAAFKALIADMPYLSKAIGWWVVAFFIVLAGAWMSLRTLQISKRLWPKVVMPVLAILGVAAAVGFASVSTTADRKDYERRLAAEAAASDSAIVPGSWLPYTPARFEKAMAANHIVVLDFTADWCIICKSLKRSVLDLDPVHSRLLAGDVVLLEVDLSSSKAPGWTFLNDLGQTGVPTLAIYGPGAKEKPLIYNAYTADTVLAAIEAAKADTRAAQR